MFPVLTDIWHELRANPGDSLQAAVQDYQGYLDFLELGQRDTIPQDIECRIVNIEKYGKHHQKKICNEVWGRNQA